PDWIKRLEGKGIPISKSARFFLNSLDFKPTTNVVNNIAVLKGELFTDGNRIITNICAEGDRQKFSKPAMEVACQISEMLMDNEIKEMGLDVITVMHTP